MNKINLSLKKYNYEYKMSNNNCIINLYRKGKILSDILISVSINEKEVPWYLIVLIDWIFEWMKADDWSIWKDETDLIKKELKKIKKELDLIDFK